MKGILENARPVKVGTEEGFLNAECRFESCRCDADYDPVSQGQEIREAVSKYLADYHVFAFINGTGITVLGGVIFLFPKTTTDGALLKKLFKRHFETGSDDYGGYFIYPVQV